MKTVDYFGYVVSVPDWAKYIAMDGKDNRYRVHCYEDKPAWHSDLKEWQATTGSWRLLCSINTTLLRCKTKPKNSLVEIPTSFMDFYEPNQTLSGTKITMVIVDDLTEETTANG